MRKSFIPHTLLAALVLALLTVGSPPTPATAGPKPEDVGLMTTPDGVEFGTWGGTPKRPAPTLIPLSGNLVDSFTKCNFLQAGGILVPKGYLCVSIDNAIARRRPARRHSRSDHGQEMEGPVGGAAALRPLVVCNAHGSDPAADPPLLKRLDDEC